MRTFILSLTFAVLGLAQTTINGGRTILGPWDASGATSTKPVKAGTSAPGTCAVGELFYDTDATAGSNLFGCTATNTWTLLGGPFTLPTASADTLGGVKVGSGLTITDGVLASTGGGGTCDPFDLTKLCIVEEFMTGTNTSGQVGANGLRFTAVSSGTLTALGQNTLGQSDHPGTFRIGSTTSANSGGVVHFSNTSSKDSAFNTYDWLNKPWKLRWIVKTDSVSDTRIRVGLSGASSAIAPSTSEPSIIFRYDTDAAFADNTKNTVGSWVAQFCAYNSTTCADTTGVYKVLNVQPTTNWALFEIERGSDGTFTWRLNGTDVATMCASGCDMTTPSVNTPLTANTMTPSVNFGISGSSTRYLYLDYLSIYMTGLTRY